MKANIFERYDIFDSPLGCAKSGSAMSDARTDIYGYNARSELVSSARTGGSPSPATEHEYAYDPIGNRQTSSDLGTARTYTANSLNQYTGISDGVDTFAPQFDDDGDQTLIQTKTGIWSVTYNGENRPVSWSCGETNVIMSFDRMGRRVSYTETVGSVTNVHQTFVYDNYLQIANSELTTSNTQLFVWDPTEPVATRPLVWRYGGSAYSYTHDGNKNVSEVVDGSGIAVAHYEYAPFGDVTVSVGNLAPANRFRFSSEYADDALGLVYYNYRHYEPVTGRWMSRDPLYEAEGKILYPICRNNVANKFDCLGKIECCKCAYTGNVLHTYESSGFHTLGKSKCFSGVVGQFLDVTLDYACYPRFFISGIGYCDAKTCKVITTYRCQFFKVHDKLNIVSYYWVYISDRVLPCFRAVP